MFPIYFAVSKTTLDSQEVEVEPHQQIENGINIQNIQETGDYDSNINNTTTTNTTTTTHNNNNNNNNRSISSSNTKNNSNCSNDNSANNDIDKDFKNECASVVDNNFNKELLLVNGKSNNGETRNENLKKKDISDDNENNISNLDTAGISHTVPLTFDTREDVDDNNRNTAVAINGNINLDIDKVDKLETVTLSNLNVNDNNNINNNDNDHNVIIITNRDISKVVDNISNIGIETERQMVDDGTGQYNILVDESDYILEDISAPFEPRHIEGKRLDRLEEIYEILEEIGDGRFGRVYKCRERVSGLELAGKWVGVGGRRGQAKRSVQTEIDIMKTLQHPRIIQLYDFFYSFKQMVLIMEIVKGGELFERIADDNAFILTERAVLMIIRQICEAAAFIHSKNIIHLDLKPENVLCIGMGSNRIKIIDFGLAQFRREEDDLKMIVGTAEFCAPEVINFLPLGFKTDMWSIGVITYILLSGYSPFLGDSNPETYCNVSKGEWEFEEEPFRNVSPNAKDFISRLIVFDRDRRMSALEALEHGWLTRRGERELTPLRKDKLKQYVIRRRWKKATNAILALRRMGWDLAEFWRQRTPPKPKDPTD